MHFTLLAPSLSFYCNGLAKALGIKWACMPLAYLLIKEVISTHSKHRMKKIDKQTDKLFSALLIDRLTWHRKQGPIRLADILFMLFFLRDRSCLCIIS